MSESIYDLPIHEATGGRLREYPDGRVMDLRSTLPGGVVIYTLWPNGTRFTLPAQHAQADEHREKVRRALALERS